VRVTGAQNLAEAEMIQGLLEANGIGVLVRRSGAFDVPDFLAGGPRDLLVRADQHAAASELVDSHFGLR
jgi:hypothetical protein